MRNVEDPAPVDVAALEDEIAKYDEEIEALLVEKQEKDEELAQRKSAAETAEREFLEIAKRVQELANSSDPINVRDGVKTGLNLYNV